MHDSIAAREAPASLSRAASAGDADHYNRMAALIAMILLSIACALPSFILPGIVSAFIAGSGLRPEAAATLGSIELALMTAALVVSSQLVNRIDRRRLAFGALAVALAGQVLSAEAGSYAWLATGRAVAGLGEGTLTAVVAAAIANTRSPDRNFALNFAATLATATLFFMLLPWLQSIGGLRGILYALVGILGCFGLALPWFPNRAPAVPSEHPATAAAAVSSHAKALSLLALCGTLLFFTAIGLVWPLMAQIGLSHHLASAPVTAALAAASIAGIVSGLFVSWLGARIGRLIPLSIGVVGINVAMAALLTGFGLATFTFAAVSFMLWWVFNTPYFLGVMAALDRSGRLAAFSLAMQTGGIAGGQALAATIVEANDYTGALRLGMILTTVALVAIASVIRLQSRVRTEELSAP
jgi:MFS transporter, DHA1 family, inner membrane transport protein